MVWGMFSATGVGHLVRFQGNANAAVYKKVVEQYVVSVMRISTIPEPIFMQDNATRHTAKIVKVFCSSENIQLLS